MEKKSFIRSSAHSDDRDTPRVRSSALPLRIVVEPIAAIGALGVLIRREELTKRGRSQKRSTLERR